MQEYDLLARIADILRHEIGPAVAADYPKTQAFMAGVVLQKLGRQLALAEAHRAAEAADLLALRQDLERLAGAGPLPSEVAAALGNLDRATTLAGLCPLIEALYAHRTSFGDLRFAILLGRVRQTLRADVDRRMAYAG